MSSPWKKSIENGATWDVRNTQEFSLCVGGFFLLFGWLWGEERVRSATDSSPSMKI